MGRIRTLPERRVLVALGLILLVGFGLRLIGVFDPIDSSYQGADAARYERIAALLYTDQQFAVPGSDAPYDWSPGAPLFYAGLYYVTGGVHPALGRLAIALLGLVTIVICFLLGRRLQRPGRRAARRAAGRHLPGLRVQHRPPAERADRRGDGARRRAGVPVGARAAQSLGVARARRADRAQRARAPRVPAVRARASRCWR